MGIIERRLKMYGTCVTKRKLTVIGLFAVFIYLMEWSNLFNKYKIPEFDPSIIRNRSLLIDTHGYKLPDFDPFDRSLERYILPPPKNLDCSHGRRPLSSGETKTLSSGWGWIESIGEVTIHEEHLSDYGVRSFSCCYHPMSRSENKSYNSRDVFDQYKLDSVCFPLYDRVTRTKAEAVMVTCTSNSIVIYRDSHVFFQSWNSTVSTKNSVKNEESISKRPLSVMILGIDSVSRLNMQRYMPQTFQILKEMGAVDLRGYNKNFENTYPNLMAMLTGYAKLDHPILSSLKKMDEFHDEVPFIWKNFTQAGYSSIYAEDCPVIGTFTYHKKSFKTPPTNYFINPYLKKFTKVIGSQEESGIRQACNICIGPRSSLDVLLKYAEDISQAMRDVPYFSLIWSNSLTHDILHYSGLTDYPLLKFLSKMRQLDYWNNTVLFLISDHGNRQSSIRKTFIGKMEESLPFGFVIFPKWFKQTHKMAYRNFEYNQFRLTTPFDFYETFLDILKGNYKDEKYLQKEYDYLNPDYKLSLFRKIHNFRTCSSARIPLNYCAGVIAKPVSTSLELVVQGSMSVVDKINQGLKHFPSCVQLMGWEIKKSYLVDFYGHKSEQNANYYILQIVTQPGKARLEALVKSERTDLNLFNVSIVGNVNRINSYKGQSDCITDLVYEKYCFCRSLVNTFSNVSNQLRVSNYFILLSILPFLPMDPWKH